MQIRVSRYLPLALSLTLAGATWQASASPLALAPAIEQYAGAVYGANASFIAIDGTWQGSSVLWNETTQSFWQGGSTVGYTPIGNFGWGTGIWGRADWETINSPGGGGVPRLGAASLRVDQINHGDTCYNARYSVSWGSAQGVPITLSAGIPASACPAPGPGGAGAQIAGNLDNWTARYNGYIRITEAGRYNFGVLYDDGFFFDLIGANGQRASIGVDHLNPRDRRGFADDFILSPGLYRYELGAWDRLEAGVVDLRWARHGSGLWEAIPTDHLVAALPGPASLALTVLGGLLFASRGGRRRGSRAPR